MKRMILGFLTVFFLLVNSAMPQTRLEVLPQQLQVETGLGGLALPDELQVANIGTGVMPYDVSITTLDGGDWLSVSPLSGACADNVDVLSVSFASSGLAAGAYTGIVTVSSAGAIDSPAVVPVNLRVNQLPVAAWDLDPDHPVLGGAVREGELLAPGEFNVWNDSAAPKGEMRYEVRMSDELRVWVASISPMRGICRDEVRRLEVTYDTVDLAPGVYGGELQVMGVDVSSGEYVAEKSIDLQLTVIARTTLRMDVNRFDGSALQNMTAATSFSLWNGGGEPRQPMRFQITTDAAWLSFSPATGQVQNAAASIGVVFDAGNLAPGTYSGTVQVDAWDLSDGQRAVGAPLLLPVAFIIRDRMPRNFEPPEVRGPAYMGHTISAWPGIWNNMQRLQFEFRWESAATPAGTRSVVRGWSADATYQVRSADRGRYLRVVVRAVDPDPVPLSCEAASSIADSKFRAVPDDFDGDGISDLWFFSPSDGYWRAALSGGGAGEVLFGAAGMVAVPGDYDGNGFLDLGLYDPASGVWHVMLLPQGEYVSGHFGGGGMTAAPADYNGDGTTDLGVYWPAEGRWYIYYVNDWLVRQFILGGPDRVPVPADYDGDGQADLAVYGVSDGLWQGISSRDGGAWSVALAAGACPTPGDYDGDGKADVAVYCPRDNLWQILNSRDGSLRREQFGVSYGGAIPRSGYFDYAGSFDPAHVQLHGDFIIWCVRRASEADYFNYRGQSYQVSTEQWRVNW